MVFDVTVWPRGVRHTAPQPPKTAEKNKADQDQEELYFLCLFNECYRTLLLHVHDSFLLVSVGRLITRCTSICAFYWSVNSNGSG